MNVDEIQKYFDSKFNQLYENVATKSCFHKLLNIMDGQRKRIEELESKVLIMDSLIFQLKNTCDDQEQCQHRLCLRINGIPAQKMDRRNLGRNALTKSKHCSKTNWSLIFQT